MKVIKKLCSRTSLATTMVTKKKEKKKKRRKRKEKHPKTCKDIKIHQLRTRK